MAKINPRSFYIESLGCAKNSVDSRSMAELLQKAGYAEHAKPGNAGVIIVNTCGFIQPAREESLQVLRDFAGSKKDGQLLLAAGCLSEKEKRQLTQAVHGLDAALGTRRWADIVGVVEAARQPRTSPYLHFPETPSIPRGDAQVARTAQQGGSAYLKIADGCDRVCAFCAIPLIKGPMVSRDLPDILADAQSLQKTGVKEIILIAQDATAYGRDLGMRDGLPLLLKELEDAIPGLPWVRIMYTFPGSISRDLINTMANSTQIVPYLDIPLQHAHPDVLRRMRRPADVENVHTTLNMARAAMPGLAIRTTFIVGFPGETEQEFEYLLDFVGEMRFDHVGIFPYYHESGTKAFGEPDSVPEEVKQTRIQALAALQEEVSLSINQSYIGKHLQVLVEGNGDGISAGRSYRDAPEIDGLVMLDEVIPPGEMATTQITGALIHDLIGKRVK
jgi:ribosomal protein S12 methylthiotransferase